MAKKRASIRGWKIFTGVIIAGIAIMIVFAIRDWWLGRRAHFVMYDAFGIDMPVNYLIHGIDVSKYQQVIDWESVRDMNVNNIRIGFGFIKATEGIGNRDPRFRQNW